VDRHSLKTLLVVGSISPVLGHVKAWKLGIGCGSRGGSRSRIEGRERRRQRGVG